MEFKTKFNIGDEVFARERSGRYIKARVTQVGIGAIEVRHPITHEVRIEIVEQYEISKPIDGHIGFVPVSQLMTRAEAMERFPVDAEQAYEAIFGEPGFVDRILDSEMKRMKESGQEFKKDMDGEGDGGGARQERFS